MDRSRIRSATVAESIRKRPAMYIGGIDLGGLVHYFVLAFELLLSENPTRIAVTVEADGFEISTDRALTVGLVVELPRELLVNHLHQLSCFYPQVRFALRAEGTVHEFHSPRGLQDLFDGFAKVFVPLHRPIHIAGQLSGLTLEAVFAFQSRSVDSVISFANGELATANGTHEMGFLEAVSEIILALHPTTDGEWDRNGIVGILSIQYRGLDWQGATCEKIVNPELQSLVHEMTLRQTSDWLNSHSDVKAVLSQIHPFRFPGTFGG